MSLKMRVAIGLFAAVFGGVALLGGAIAWAEDDGVKAYGLVHNIAKDRKIEKIGGLHEPEGIDKYMKRHFDQIHSKLNKLDERLGRIEKSVELLKGDGKKPSTLSS